MGRGKEYKDMMEQLILVTQLGLTMAGSILLCFAIGYFLDKWLGTKGLFLIVFIILGVIGGGWTVYRQILRSYPEEPGEKPSPDDSRNE